MTKTNTNLEWADNLRFIATIFVIIIHVIFPVVQNYATVDTGAWHTANIIESLCRSAVPIFVMLSGALLLGKQENIDTFYNKRIKKIGLPFLCWSFIYFLVAYISEFVIGSSTQDKFLWFVNNLKNGSCYHLWYLYMILGLYLIIPYLSKIVPSLKNKDYYFFITIWTISLFLNFPAIKDYFPNFDITFFTGYIGYLLLGFFLSDILSKQLSFRFGMIIFIVGWLTTFLLTWISSSSEQKFVPTYYNYLSPNIALIAVGLFIMIIKSSQSNNLYSRISKIISDYSYGIYLNHVLFITIGFKLGLSWKTLNPFLGVSLTFLFVILLSVTFVWISEKLKLRKFFG